MISVIIPVKDGGEDLVRCLTAIGDQDVADSVEVVVIDSGSTDSSPARARALGALVEVIAPEDFNHGQTRNLGVRLASGDMLVFISQDAFPLGSDWLARLTAPLREEDRLAGTYGRQVAHVDASPSERFFLDFLYGPTSRRQRAAGASELSMETTLFSNVNSAIRREVLERFTFVEDIIMSEDQEWARRVLLAGYGLAYVADAGVAHSHPYTIAKAFRRFFDSGVSAERAYLAGARPSAAVLRRQALRYARQEMVWLWRTGERRAMPYAVIYELAKFVGLQLGARHRRLPVALKRRLSALPVYWSSSG